MTAYALATALAAALLAAAPLPPPRVDRPKNLPAAKRAKPPEPKPDPAVAQSTLDQLLVEQKCAKCHDTSLAYRSGLDDASWRLHMKRMANRPGAAITDEQAARIHAYLKKMAAGSASR